MPSAGLVCLYLPSSSFPISYDLFTSCDGGGGGGGVFLTSEDLGGRFDESFLSFD